MRSYQILLLFAALGVAVQASPLASMLGLERVRRAAQVTTVDCTNREAVMFVLRTRANFRCVYPEYNKATQYKISEDASQFGDDLETANLIREDKTNCGEGFMYSLDFDMCLEIPNQLENAVPLETGNLMAENPIMEITSFSSGPSSADDCPKGQIYNSELNFCSDMPNAPAYQPLATGNLHKEEEVAPIVRAAYYDPNGCAPNQIYASSIDMCVDKRGASKRNGRELESASLTREDPPRTARQLPEAQQDPNFCRNSPQTTRLACSNHNKYCFYQSSLGVCQPIRRATRPRHNYSSKRGSSRAFLQPIGCGDLEIFSPTIGICVPLTLGTGRQLESASLVMDHPAVDRIQSFQSEASPEMCRLQGKFFNYEVGLCL